MVVWSVSLVALLDKSVTDLSYSQLRVVAPSRSKAKENWDREYLKKRGSPEELVKELEGVSHFRLRFITLCLDVLVLTDMASLWTRKQKCW